MWKKYQSAQKSRKNLSSIFLSLGLLFFVLSVARIVHIVTVLGDPLTPNLTTAKKYVWEGKSAVNVIFAFVDTDKPIFSVLSFNPKDEKVTILNIPDQTYVDVPKNYGSWKLGSVYQLGQEEKDPIGADLLKLSVSRLVGLHIDGIILLDRRNGMSVEEIVEDLKKNPLSRFAFLNSHLKSDLTGNEANQLFWSLSKVRSDKLVSLNLERSKITESKLLPDSSRVLGVNTIALDLFIRDKMSDTSIAEEELSVAVFNATGYPGLAQQAARVITNLGGNVVLIANADGILERSIVLADKERQKEKSLTEERLTQIFASDCLRENCITVDPKVASSRAQINVVLGRDYYEKWYQR